MEIARGAGSTDEDLLALGREGEGRRLRSKAPPVNARSRTEALRKGVDAKVALDIPWAITGMDHYRLFVVERKRPLDRCEYWLEKMMTQQLLLR